MIEKQKILRDADIPKRRKYDRADFLDTLTVAASHTSRTGKTVYVLGTAYGWTHWHEAPVLGTYGKTEKVTGGVLVTKGVVEIGIST